jgi:DNA invertase Pin-like site-specific DNA recombinase
MNLKPGQYIRHAKYGCGTVVTCENDRTTVDFDTAGLKIFVSSLAAFEPAEGQAPKRRQPAAKHRAKACHT